MTDEKVVLDKETFKALSVDSRLTILKTLKLRRHTLSELTSVLNLSQSTVKEHLQRLEQAELIQQMDEGRKWKYYKLTLKGKNVVDPKEIKVMFLFAGSVVAAIGAGFYFVRNLFSSPGHVTSLQAQSTTESAPMAADTMMARSAESMPLAQSSDAGTLIGQLPIWEITMAVVMVVAVAGIIVSIIYFYKQKKALKHELEKTQ